MVSFSYIHLVGFFIFFYFYWFNCLLFFLFILLYICGDDNPNTVCGMLGVMLVAVFGGRMLR
jgi:hypothetical protein